MFTGLFTDKTALLTAATSGIGLQSARLIAEGGARAVVLNGRDAESGQAAVDLIKQAAPDCDVSFVAADLTEAKQVEEMYGQVLAEHGRVDVQVHAGGAQVKPNLFVNTDPADYQPLIDGHFGSILNCCRFAVPAMIEQGNGSIVVVVSDAGKVATPAETIIGAMKAAAIMFVRTLAMEVSRNGVRVNAVSPSLVTDTKSHDRVMSGEMGRRVFEKATARAKLGLPGPADVANTAVFLASPLAAKITG